MPLIPFRQADYPGVGPGVCWALSMKWVHLSLSGNSDEQQGRIDILKGWIPTAIALQAEYQTLHSIVSPNASLVNTNVLKVAGLIQFFGARIGIEIDQRERTEVLMTMNDTLNNLDQIAERLKTPGTGHILSFQYKNGTAHAMATRARSAGFWNTVGNSTFLFDPNGGELDMNKDIQKGYLRNHFTTNNANTLLIVKVKLI